MLDSQGKLTVADIRARRLRNQFSIRGFTGANGGGKTMCAVFDSLPTLAAGRPIVSTCRILDPLTGEPHPLWVPLDDFRVLLEVEFCDVILDEVTGVASSRESAGLPSAVLNHLMQLRKRDVNVSFTTPNWKRADTAIREVTQGLTTCQGFAPSNVTVETEDGLTRSWRPKRGHLWRTYDAKNFDEWSTAKERSSSKAHRLRPVARQVVWGPYLHAREFYDTYEHALTVGAVSEAGLCMTCGYKRRAPTCKCTGADHDNHDDSAGMLRWREVHSERMARVQAARPRRLVFAETDETPAVAVEVG